MKGYITIPLYIYTIDYLLYDQSYITHIVAGHNIIF